MPTSSGEYRILSLDGGGSKGIYTIGVLSEIEALARRPLHEEFDLIYGTSTGSIIASQIALGLTLSEIRENYLRWIPKVMRHKTRRGRSTALAEAAKEIYKDKSFSDLKCMIGIVTTNYDRERPMIFKNSDAQAHAQVSTFKPGFGSDLSDAILASCAAFPFFGLRRVQTTNQGSPLLIDGGYVANNPSLFAIADAVKIFSGPRASIKLLSVGVGQYNEPNRSLLHRVLFSIWPFFMIQKMFAWSSNTVEQLRVVLFPDIPCIRIDDAYPDSRYATDLLESDRAKLDMLAVLGRESYARREADLRRLFGW